MSDRPTVEQVQRTFDSFLLLADRDVVRLMLAVIIGNQMTKRFPIWTMLVAPPSSGKTTLLNSLVGLKLKTKSGDVKDIIHSISDLTTNSFASGIERHDKEPSLLNRVGIGDVMVFKDFTSLLSKHRDEKKVVMGQLREIYDGSYKKLTGNGKNIEWNGKLGAFAGVTQAVYQHLEEFAIMGDRFMFYQVLQPDRKEMLKFKIRQEQDGTSEAEMMPKARECVHQYIQYAFDNLRDVKIYMDEKTQDEIIEVADFCTMVRSGIVINEYNNLIQFVPAPEMPARMFDQMMGIASAFSLMRMLDQNAEDNAENVLTPNDFKIMYKVAYDSIPLVRRFALTYLAKYKKGIETSALATKLNYSSEVTRTWLEQLNALGIVTRRKTASGTNFWTLDEKYRNVMVRLQHIKVLDEYMSETGEDAVEVAWESSRYSAPSVDDAQEMIDNEYF